jgi:hypothetical protein
LEYWVVVTFFVAATNEFRTFLLFEFQIRSTPEQRHNQRVVEEDLSEAEDPEDSRTLFIGRRT